MLYAQRRQSISIGIIVIIAMTLIILSILLWGRALPELVHAVFGKEILETYFFINECDILVTCPKN